MANSTSTTVAVTTTPTNTTLDNSTTTVSLTTGTSTELSTSTNSTWTIISTTPTSNEEPSYTGAIVGGVIGGLAALVLIAVGVICFIRRRRRKIKKRQDKLNNLPPLPTVDILNQTEIENSKKKIKWSKKKKPDVEIQPTNGECDEPHYVNQEKGKSEKSEPLYLKPEPPQRDIYDGLYGTEYYMESPEVPNKGEEPIEVYSDPNTPDLRQTNNFPNEEAPKPPDTNSNEHDPTDYENVPKKQIGPPKTNPAQTYEVEEDEEQIVYENQ